MLTSYVIEEQPPTDEAEIKCREELLMVVDGIANEFGLEMEPFTIWEEGDSERLQGIFIMASTASGPWCIGAIIRRHNGELRVWPRDDISGPIHRSTVVKADQLESHILNMVDQFTGPFS